ncbi:MAG: hypothetical protein IPO85_06975 [Saprospiraceae bacterium]|uniref:Uncharacterized protein n=1 Tax=Candidatus Defluviibacterium haderslevense TaxID=2981993 RepID=A0A9D7S7B7_9BACT|nr:hypothetical protein [Candidatus Defluviibacterium haderslevense]
MNDYLKEKWLHISILNLSIVALLGVIMRYKIGFEFPYFDQKHIQHAHSHFAFSGWIAHTLFVLMLMFLDEQKTTVLSKYKPIIIGNLVCAYGMLFSFAIQGYGVISIFFSTLSILNTYIFIFCFLKDLKLIGPHPSKNWFKASLAFYIFSSLGTFALAYMMITKHLPQNYLASVYYYLHFQYNGFFFFSCMGLFISQLYRFIPILKFNSQIFWLFAIACIPTYFLSTLWMKLPIWLYILVVIGAFMQVLGWIKLLQLVQQNLSIFKTSIKPIWRKFFLILALAISIKLLLQLGSVIPSLSKLAFGFRPIVIAYLHLVLLAIISFFLVVYIFCFNALGTFKNTITAITIFVFGIFFNEFILLVQGIGSFSYTLIPYANETLFVAAIIMFFGLVALLIIQLRKLNSYD